MLKFYCNILGFKKISLNSNDLQNFNIRKIYIKNGDRTLHIDNFTINSENSFIIFLKEKINIKYPCLINYEGLQVSAFYSNLFSTSEFNEKFYYDGELGLFYKEDTSNFKVWSPAATSVSLLLYKNGDISIHESPREFSMVEGKKGVWEVTIHEDLNKYFYTYKIKMSDYINEAVDPYARAVGINGERGAIIDLNTTNPNGWNEDNPTYCKKVTDAIIYETSIRDISIHKSSNILHKGKYLGLTEDNTISKKGISTCLSHIKELGITHLQLMPFYDFSYTSVDEKNPSNYNWGYMPQNYNVPEGSFSLNPYDPKCRILELKTMIKHLHANNISIVMDVVYNHMNHHIDNNFQRIFPEYYFRYNEDGTFSEGSGCGNDTASERPMMRKFIIDSLCYWAQEYHLDGFRFDLMGLHDINTMNLAYEKLSILNNNIILYGEGWDLKTNLSQSLKTTQDNSFKTPNIGFFNDTIRDTIKGNVFSLKDRGFVSGKENLENIIKGCVLGSSITLEKFKAIYTSPAQSINYVTCHDNNTLWDKLNFSNCDDSIEDLKAMVKLSNAIILTSQGVPFLHSGVEFCRTKEGIENSFNYPDKINSLDYDRKAEFIDVFNYYKGLIKLRREHPAFRMSNVEEIKANIEFIPNSPKNTVVFLIKNSANGDSWDNILVVYNANKHSVNIDVPYNSWHGVVDKNNAGISTLNIVNSNKIHVEGICMNVFFSG